MKYKVNDIVDTEFGTGKIIKLENFKYAKRYGIEFSDKSIKYLFEKEIYIKDEDHERNCKLHC